MEDLHIEGMEMTRAKKKKRNKEQRKSGFKVQWVKFPWRWAKALQQTKNASTYRLAIVILFEAFKRDQIGGEIVLSGSMTGMHRNSRRRATEELVRLKLIEIEQYGNGAIRVSNIIL